MAEKNDKSPMMIPPFRLKTLSRRRKQELLFMPDDETATCTTTFLTKKVVNYIRALSALLAVGIFMFLSSDVISCIKKPKLPIVQLDSLLLSNVNLSSIDQTPAQWDATVTATNPDARFSTVFEVTKVAVSCKGLYNDATLVTRVGDSFVTRNMTLNATSSDVIKATGGIGSSDIVFEMDRFKSGKLMRFEVEITAAVIQMAFSLWDERRGMRFTCDDVVVDFVADDDGKALFNSGMTCLQTQQ